MDRACYRTWIAHVIAHGSRMDRACYRAWIAHVLRMGRAPKGSYAPYCAGATCHNTSKGCAIIGLIGRAFSLLGSGMVYISKQQILTRFRRYKALNETRLQRARALMGPRARRGLEIVPVLLHYNHICLPGYRTGYIPHGIDLFTPNEFQLSYLRSILAESLSEACLDTQDALADDAPDAERAARAQQQAARELNKAELLAAIPPLEEPVQHDILGLYAMGSTSSIGQSQGSDLDIWVCVRAHISPEGISALQDKCRFITTYVKSLGVDLNLFVTPEDRFTNFQPDQLDEENCGSAQNLFLLDEFYRSSIRLCGRYIIWYLISTREEQGAYQDYVKFLLEGKSNLPKFSAHIPEPQAKPGLSTHGMSHILMSALIGDEEAYYAQSEGALARLMEVPEGSAYAVNNSTAHHAGEAASSSGKGESRLDKLKGWYHKFKGPSEAKEQPQPAASTWTYRSSYSGSSSGRSTLSGLTSQWRLPSRPELERVNSSAGAGADNGLELADPTVYPVTSLGVGPASGAGWRPVPHDELASDAAPDAEKTASAAALAASGAAPAPEAAFNQPLESWSTPYPDLSVQESEALAQSLSERRDFVLPAESIPEVVPKATSTSGFERLVQAMGVSPVPLWGKNMRRALSYASVLNQSTQAASDPAYEQVPNAAAPEARSALYVDSYFGTDTLPSDALSYPSADVRAAEVRPNELRSNEVRNGAANGRVGDRLRRVAESSLILPTVEECEELATRDGWVEGEAPLDAAEWFDFGTVVFSSPTEYFGSGLWLLYKGIDSPFKVVLKILLMEAYSSSYPHTRLLSSELKDYMLSHDGYSLDLDSYYLMYLKVSQYLQEGEDNERLELMRKCFYLKLYMGLNQSSETYHADDKIKRELLDKLSSRWGWSKEYLTELENVSGWKMNQARRFNREVFNTLIESYLALLRFTVRHGIEYAITSDDAGVLSRKLYAAFDRYPGKILVMHTSLFHNLEERHLTFICPSPQSLCRKGWHLYTAANYDIGLLNQRVTYIGTRLSEVVAWSCFNGLLTPRTKIHVAGNTKGVTPSKIKQLSSDIMRVLEPSMKQVSEQSMQRGFKLKSCVVVVNLEEDNTNLLKNQVLATEYGSTLCYGHQRLCLVGSVDLIVVNAWGEAIAINLPSGEEGVVELLSTLLRIVTNSLSLTPLPSVEPVLPDSTVSDAVSKLTQASALAQSASGIGAQAAVGASSLAYSEGVLKGDDVSQLKAQASTVAAASLLGALAPHSVTVASKSKVESERAIATNEELNELLSHIEVCSYAESYQDLIKYDLESTVRQVCNCLLRTGSSEYVFEVGRNSYIARTVGERGVKINKKSVFGSNDFDISVVSGYGMRPEHALQVPPIVDRYANTGIVQYFFMPLPDKGHWDIYIVNERNEVNIYHDYYGSRASLVNAINRFYTQQSQNRLLRTARFNLPQYYVLSQDQRSLHPFTIHSD